MDISKWLCYVVTVSTWTQNILVHIHKTHTVHCAHSPNMHSANNIYIDSQLCLLSHFFFIRSHAIEACNPLHLVTFPIYCVAVLGHIAVVHFHMQWCMRRNENIYIYLYIYPWHPASSWYSPSARPDCITGCRACTNLSNRVNTQNE